MYRWLYPASAQYMYKWDSVWNTLFSDGFFVLQKEITSRDFFYEFNNVHPLEYHKCSHKSSQTRKIWTKKDKFIAKQTGVEKLREKRSNYQKINSGCIPLKENDQ